MTNIQAINNALAQEMERDENVVVLGEDVGVDGGVFRATEGLQKKFGVNRVFDTPLAEAGIIGTAIGMALYGLRPVAEIQFSGFTTLAYNQLVDHAAKFRNRSRGRYTAPIVVRAPHSGGFRALEHHGESQETSYIHIPGLKVIMPSTPFDTKGLLIAAIRDPDPVIFFEPIKLYRAFKEDVPEKPYTVQIGKANVIKDGKDITLITYGTMTRPTEEAAKTVEAEGIDCEIIDLRTLSPLDWDTVLSSVKKTGRAVVVHEAPKTLGLGAEISARINENILFSLEAPVLRVTGYDTPMPYLKMEGEYIPNAAKIVKAIKEVMKS